MGDDECALWWPDGYDAGSMICAGRNRTDGQYDACNGDSGGPLTLTYGDKHQKRRPILLGIVSYGVFCGISDSAAYPGVYTEVSQFTNWIYTNIIKEHDGRQFFTSRIPPKQQINQSLE
jgi:secreted trypsin-like serine protease